MPRRTARVAALALGIAVACGMSACGSGKELAAASCPPSEILLGGAQASDGPFTKAEAEQDASKRWFVHVPIQRPDHYQTRAEIFAENRIADRKFLAELKHDCPGVNAHPLPGDHGEAYLLSGRQPARTRINYGA
ncbi:MAG TPA: hypothetical protein VMA83_00505 [Solirubrobacteraceae bacterium]|nr:hypothetical protein [Solirubrobacteraceae bacterium]